MQPSSKIFPILHHKHMLCDSVRIKAYANAIDKHVSQKTRAVEIGTGTGILTAILAQKTKEFVCSIEYFEEVARFAERNLKKCGIHNAQIIQARSYDVTLDTKPELLVTETIGPIGPEENIVLLCYDFVKRHPSIRRVIPNQLTLYALPLWSDDVEKFKNSTLNAYVNYRTEDFNFENEKTFLVNELSRTIFEMNLKSSTQLLPAEKIVSYKLGQDFCADFIRKIFIPTDVRFNCLHIFFEANLDDNVTLTSSFKDKDTHWGHIYVLRPESKSNVTISYKTEDGFHIFWE